MHDIMKSKDIQAEKSWWELWHNIDNYSNLTEKEPDKTEKEFYKDLLMEQQEQM